MPSREVRAALRLLKIRPLPANLGDLARPGVLAQIRHEFSNYDRLRFEFRFDEADYRSFKWEVNRRIAEVINEPSAREAE